MTLAKSNETIVKFLVRLQSISLQMDLFASVRILVCEVSMLSGEYIFIIMTGYGLNNTNWPFYKYRSIRQIYDAGNVVKCS